MLLVKSVTAKLKLSMESSPFSKYYFVDNKLLMQSEDKTLKTKMAMLPLALSNRNLVAVAKNDWEVL